MTLSRRAVAEVLGTAFLVAAVVGSGIMGQKLARGNMGIALLANALATGATLVTLIFTFGPISGGHFNPAVTLADASQGGISWRDVPAYIGAQLLGAFIGLGAAHLMFGEALGIDISGHRSKHVDEFQGQSFDYVLTVCDNARESCPVFPGHAKRIHNAFEDPAVLHGTEEERLALFRLVRNEIQDYLKTFPAKAG